MEFTPLSDQYCVSAQVSPSQVLAIKDAGFSTIMCNRPDGEEADQPDAATIRQAAEQAGLKFFHLPIGRDGISADMLAEFRKITSAENGSVFAYCRTGNRCTVLWNSAG